MLNFQYKLAYDATKEWNAYYVNPNDNNQLVHMGMITENDNGTFSTATISIAAMVDDSIKPEIIPIEFEQKDHAAMYVLARDTTPERKDAINEARAIMDKMGMGLSAEEVNEMKACEVIDIHYDSLHELTGVEWEKQVRILIKNMYPNSVDSTDKIIEKIREIDD